MRFLRPLDTHLGGNNDDLLMAGEGNDKDVANNAQWRAAA
jgi:hypothetical protein